jgi:hypothetical protein
MPDRQERYPTDLGDAEWAVLEPLLPPQPKVRDFPPPLSTSSPPSSSPASVSSGDASGRQTGPGPDRRPTADAVAASPTTDVDCRLRPRCGKIATCDEADAYLEQCGLTKLDGRPRESGPC